MAAAPHLEYEMRTRLLADPVIAGLVGTRMEPDKLPENTAYPAIIFARSGERTLHHLRGPSGRAMPNVTITSFGNTSAQSWVLADAVKRSLDGFNGILTTIKAVIKMDNATGGFDFTVSKYIVIQEFFVNMAEPR